MSDNENTALVAQVLSSYFSNNTVAPADLQSVIETVKTAFGLSATSASAAAVGEPEKLEPAVSVKKSITPDALICLCCGEKFKSLKRHLQTEHNISPDEYRARFSLKNDYPLVAPNYSAARSALAKSAGFGRKPVAATPPKKAAGKKQPGRKTTPKEAAE